MFRDDFKTELHHIKVDDALLDKTRRRILSSQIVESETRISMTVPRSNHDVGRFFRRHALLFAALLTAVIGLSLFFVIISSGAFHPSKSADSAAFAQGENFKSTEAEKYNSEANSFGADKADEPFSVMQEEACILSIDPNAPELNSDSTLPVHAPVRDSLHVTDTDHAIMFSSTLPNSNQSVTICEYRNIDPDDSKNVSIGEPDLPLIEVIISDVSNIDAPVLLTSYWIPGHFADAMMVDDYLYVSTIYTQPASEAPAMAAPHYAINDLPWQDIETIYSIGDLFTSFAFVASIDILDSNISPIAGSLSNFIAVIGSNLTVSINDVEIVVRDASESTSTDEYSKQMIRFYTRPNLERVMP